MTEKVLVTGGVGFIGSHIVDKLVQEGFDVVVVDNLSTGDVQNVNSLARFYHADINNASFIFKKEQPDYVAHHAAQINVRSSIDDPVNDAEQNIMKSLRLIELCRKFKTKKFVFASSGGTVYGNPDSLPAKEDAELKPLSPYGIAKATVERYLEFYFRNFGFEYIALRYANVYGPRQNPKGEAGVISVFINQMLNGQRPCIWGDGAQTRDFVYVDDVAEANLAAIRYTGQFRRFNIGYGEETSVNSVFALLAKYLDSGDHSHNLEYKEELPRIILDCSLAARELGWKAKVSLEQGLRRTISYFEDKRNIPNDLFIG